VLPIPLLYHRCVQRTAHARLSGPEPARCILGFLTANQREGMGKRRERGWGGGDAPSSPPTTLAIHGAGAIPGNARQGVAATTPSSVMLPQRPLHVKDLLNALEFREKAGPDQPSASLQDSDTTSSLVKQAVDIYGPIPYNRRNYQRGCSWHGRGGRARLSDTASPWESPMLAGSAAGLLIDEGRRIQVGGQKSTSCLRDGCDRRWSGVVAS